MQAGAGVSRIYERWWRPALGRVAKGVGGPGMADEQRIARLLLGLGPGDGVLDVACGPGNFSRDFARAVGDDGPRGGHRRVAADARARGARDRRAGVDNLVFVHGDAAALPFRDASFDAVCCFAALNLFAEPFKALDEMRRVLTPGRADRDVHELPRPLRRRCARSRRRSPRRRGMRMFEQDEIVDALRERGFTDVRQRLAGAHPVRRRPAAQLAAYFAAASSGEGCATAPSWSITICATRSRCQRASPNITASRSRASGTGAGRAPR